MTETETYLAEVEARCEKATPGPWSFPAKTGDCYVCFGEIVNSEIQKAVTHSQDEMALAAPNLEFIAHVRTDIPKLIEMLRAMSAMKEYAAQCFANSEQTVRDQDREIDTLETRLNIAVKALEFQCDGYNVPSKVRAAEKALAEIEAVA